MATAEGLGSDLWRFGETVPIQGTHEALRFAAMEFDTEGDRRGLGKRPVLQPRKDR